MDTQVVVSIVGSITSIALALIAAKNERKREVSKSSRARPFLIFAATGALLLSLTVLGITFYLQSLPRLGYASSSIVITAGEPDPAGWGKSVYYSAPLKHTATAKEYEVPLEVPAGGSIVGAWYTPEDAIGQIAQFSTINVVPKDASHVALTIRGNDNETFMRIRLHAAYTR